ncbi:Ankyrin repeat and SOCS box protein 9 [Merluccius polli]|uniref:Ankyrin repeat and SOCS box protein 9 n=1 Tax=Merluccius polli TaxID=89951 RepID=A0AA47N1G7_MERPO|nr:Ankyrin repeat and SOCS box protein 9 [Merluccius polli]
MVKIKLKPALPTLNALNNVGWKVTTKSVAASLLGQQKVSSRGEAIEDWWLEDWATASEEKEKKNSESDWSPVHDAAFNGRLLGLQKLLSQGAPVNLATLDRVSPLHGACQQGHTECARLLIQNGAYVNSATVDGTTPLSEACARGHKTCVSLLLQHGATPLGPAGHFCSPLHRAAAEGLHKVDVDECDVGAGHLECVVALVEHGADVDQHAEHSGTPLCAAVANQHLSTARKLLQLRASANSSVDGESLLHTAARLSNPELVSVLLDHGADGSARNLQGRRPVDLAPPNSLVQRMLGASRGIRT